MGAVIPFPVQRIHAERPVNKRTIASMRGRSSRWVELNMRDHGLPFHRTTTGEARFFPSEVAKWEDERRT